MTATLGLAVVAALVLVLGLMLVRLGRAIRWRRGLGEGRTISLDRVTLTSRRLGLTGRPDRLIRTGGTVIVEEWKKSRLPRPWHRAQMGVYFLLVEDRFGVKPTHGFLVCGDGSRHRVENSEDLRAWVLDLAGRIRSASGAVTMPISVRPVPGQCRPCGMRGHCGQARG